MNYIAERRQEEKERRRAEILDAAEAVTASGGWDELTMDQVARRARLSRALLYVYFKDKTDLMYGICGRGLEVLRRQCEDVAARHESGFEQVMALTRAYVALSQEYPVYFDIMARCTLREVRTEGAPENETNCNLAGDAMGARISAMIVRGMSDGSIRRDLGSVPVAASALWGFAQGVIQIAFSRRALLEHQGVKPDRMLDTAIDLMARSITARA